MTDFDTRLAELEDEANRGRVPELKIVVELFKMLHPGSKDGRCMDPSHQTLEADSQMHVVCATCKRPKMPKF